MIRSINPGSVLPVYKAIVTCAFLSQNGCYAEEEDIERVESALNALGQAIEAIPPTVADHSLICYLRNRQQSSRILFQQGEREAARYQLQEMARKLGSAWRRMSQISDIRRLTR